MHPIKAGHSVTIMIMMKTLRKVSDAELLLFARQCTKGLPGITVFNSHCSPIINL